MLVVYHAPEGLLLVAISAAVLVLSLTHGIRNQVRLFTILGFGSTISAAVGGLLFVLSDFSNNGNSAQMGGSFIGAYAFYFLALYFTK